MSIKKTALSIVLLSLSGFYLFAQAQDSKNLAYINSLLEQAENNTAFFETDFTGNYEVVQEKPGEGRSRTTATIYRRDSKSCWTILVSSPAKDKGKGYLQTDSGLWFFDPADHRFTFSSPKDKFQGTNANTSDFAPQHYMRDYSIQSASDVKLGSYDCILYILKAKVKDVEYPEIHLWVSKKDGLARKKEDYSLSGQKLRTSAIPSYQTVNENGKAYMIPVSMIIQDDLRKKQINNKTEYERTLISISNVSLKKVEDTVYTKPYLELMSGK